MHLYAMKALRSLKFPIWTLLEPALQLIEPGLELLAAGGVGEPDIALRPEGGPWHKVDVGRLEAGPTKLGRVVHLVAPQRAAEVGGDVKESIERTARHGAVDSRNCR